MSRKEIMLSLARLLRLLLLTLFLRIASATVSFTTDYGNLEFSDIQATFTPRINSSGISGIINGANPSDGCSNITSSPPRLLDRSTSIVIIEDGVCSYEKKVQNAQAAGFAAVIVFNTVSNDLVEMTGEPEGIYVPAVYVSADAGRTILQQLIYQATNCYITDDVSSPNRGLTLGLEVGFTATAIVLFALIVACCYRTKLRNLGKRLVPPSVSPQDELRASQPAAPVQLSANRPPPDSIHQIAEENKQTCENRASRDDSASSPHLSSGSPIRDPSMIPAQKVHAFASTSSDGDPAKQSAQDNGQCVICWETQVEGVCIPCGHLAGCMGCLNMVKAKDWGCPICRAPIQQVVKVYV